MSQSLVIVESPAKVKTIKKYLGSSYIVDASNGHVRDLPKSTMGIDIEHDYEPKYITIRGKGDIIKKLKKEVKKADKIYLATDPDREGEAISWHLIKALKLDETDKKVYRISFNEITKNAIKESIKNPREIDMDLVDAQQARRALDRVVGYSISPLLWSKIKSGLSAGRVQSVALRMVCDREAAINAFIPSEYWNIEAQLTFGKSKPFSAKYHLASDEVISTQEQCEAIVSRIEKETFIVDDIKNSTKTRKAPLPFTTSTLQQEASKQLNFSTQKTMRIAQQLYEGVTIKGHGTVALITYLRTDSTRVSDEAQAAATNYIGENYGENYIAQTSTANKSGSKIQDAHEAIRPTDITLTPAMVKDSLQRDLFRLYQLIWRRFVASRMTNAIYDTMSIKIKAGDALFTAGGSVLKFDGFMSVYRDDEEKEGSIEKVFTQLSIGDKLGCKSLEKSQHFTQPPAHFTEASLVKALEEQGIGRPSTYAPTITNILARRYIIKEQKNLYVTELGQVINDIMVKQFAEIVDKGFTAEMEKRLDQIEEGQLPWKSILEEFYPKLEASVKKAEKELESITIADEVTDEICDECGKNLVIKYGPHGKFLACPGFPDCRFTKPFLEKIGVPCPICQNDVVIRKTRKGRSFYGCFNYPECGFMSWDRPTAEKCPKCGTYMVEKGEKLVCSDQNCGYFEKNTKKEANGEDDK